MRCIDVVKLFLVAEQTGNWLLNLNTVHTMLPIVAATGHFNYAKSARLYLQQMNDLENNHPDLHMTYIDGNHTVRRSDRFCSGLSLDLVIGQTVVRAIRSRGRLTRGRGLHETVCNTWLSTMTDCGAIRSTLASVVGLDKTATEHVEMGATHMCRDVSDFHKLRNCLHTYSPFKFIDATRLISLSSGLVAGVVLCLPVWLLVLMMV